MSKYYSKYDLNTYCGAPYFEAHIPADYPLRLVMVKSRAFRRLPPRLRELSALAKQWGRRKYPDYSDGIEEMKKYYDADGYELDPYTGRRLTDEEIDAQWGPLDQDDEATASAAGDIPIPEGGFADPDTWEEPPPKPYEPDPDDIPTEEQLLRDIALRGRERTAEEYGIPVDQLPRSPVRDEWEAKHSRGTKLSTDAAGHEHAPKGPPVKPTGAPAPAPAPPAPAPPASPAEDKHAQAHRDRLARATVAHQDAMNVLGSGQALPGHQKRYLAKNLSVMNKHQLRSLYRALGGAAAIVGAQRQPWVHAIKAILSGGAAAPQPALTPAAPSPAPPTAPAPTPAPATPAAPSPAIVDDPHNLSRFVQAQKGDYKQGHAKYEQALSEIRSGRKCSHWMWYIFPQVDRLGSSSTSKNYKLYAIKSIAEAKSYLSHPVLGPRLMECAEAALSVQGRTAHEIFGSPDDKKLRFCATLFASVSQPGSAFDRLLDKYYQGERDSKTLRLLGIASDVK